MWHCRTSSYFHIQSTIRSSAGEKASFTVMVQLKDETFEAYKRKYGKDQSKYAWMQEKPQLPIKWNAEKGRSSHGSNYMDWEWIFTGPKDSVEAAKEAVQNFLMSFTFSFK